VYTSSELRTVHRGYVIPPAILNVYFRRIIRYFNLKKIAGYCLKFLKKGPVGIFYFHFAK